jgi:hypothetical protein
MLLLSLHFGAPAADATWSIAVTDSATGEIAIGSATCVTGIDLKQLASVVVVEKGAGAAQSFVDASGQNRLLIFQELGAGTDPVEILDLLEQQDGSHQTRQYGIADTQGRAVGFTGSVAGAFADHLTGQSGTLTYAIQGNVLAGEAVLTEAENALLNQGRDLPTRLMRAMLAAQAQGGDGRCSCSPADPDGCGTPPPGFTKSADVGYMVVTRLGDVDGVCNTSDGCASGDYYMDLNVAFQGSNDPDAVFQLRAAWQQWRRGLVGIPDHHRSRVRLLDTTLPADGVSSTVARIFLRDLLGTQIMQGGASVGVTVNGASTADATIGPVIDFGNGVYQFGITAGSSAGDVLLDVVVDDGSGPVQLAPRPLLQLVP